MISQRWQTGTGIVIVSWILISSTAVLAEDVSAKKTDWPDQCHINGRVIVSNGLKEFSKLQPALSKMDLNRGLVELRFNDGGDRTPEIQFIRDSAEKSCPLKTFEISQQHPGNQLLKSIASEVQKVECVVIVGDPPSSEWIASLQTTLDTFIDRGGLVLLSGKIGSVAGRGFSASGDIDDVSSGWDLLPDCLVTLGNGRQRQQEEASLESARQIKNSVGLVIEDDTAMMLSGRKLTCFGAGKLSLLVPKSDVTPKRRQQISEMRSRRQRPTEYLADLTQFRRMAIDRHLPKFPADTPPTPSVKKGTLLIIGGGGTPEGLMERFVELAGGIEKAHLVYVPCSESETVSARQSMVSTWKRMGVQNATVLHTKDREKADSDEQFLAPLKNATGIFFGGGRQWNFSDSYYGTRAHHLMKDVLARDGVIAGSSAGASIQASYLARATPIENFDIMAPGYERGGLGFISGVAIDQHFSQRNRQKDMQKLMKAYPQLLGIGIDEATAIEVRQSFATVSGRGRVYFYDASRSKKNPAHWYTSIPAGGIYELAMRLVIVEPTLNSDN